MHFPRLRVLTVMLLVALIAVALAGLRRWRFDPSASRLPAGAVAVLGDDAAPASGSVAVYPLPAAKGLGQWVPVRRGSRVKILDDTSPSYINSFETDGVMVRGEDRDVRITVLDGKRASFTGYVSRFYLRPTR